MRVEEAHLGFLRIPRGPLRVVTRHQRFSPGLLLNCDGSLPFQQMKLLTLLLTLSAAPALYAADNPLTNRPPAQAGKTYELGPDSLPQEGVPKGKLEGPFLFKSQV